MKKTKVVFCTDGISPHRVGGMQRHSELLIKELAKCSDLEIIVIHPHVGNVFGDKRIQEVSVEDTANSRFYLMNCYIYSKKVYQELQNFPDALIYSQGLSVWYGLDALKYRLIVNPHGLEPYQVIGLRNKIIAMPFKLIFNFIFKRANTVISLGGKLTDILTKIVPNNSSVVEIPNGVNLPAKYFDKALNSVPPINVFFLARFESNKGINILFDAIKKLNELGFENSFKFHLAGTGTLYNYYCVRNVFANVELLGFVNDERLSVLYEANDLFVLPTLFEGMPTVVLEAMSFSLPVIVSDVGATRDIVDDNNGKLIRPGNVDDLVAALLWYLNLESDGKIQLSTFSRNKIIDFFTWEIVAGKHIELFKSI